MESQLLSPLHKATRQITLYFGEKSQDFGLSSDEAHVLAYLLRYQPCPTGDVQRVLGCQRSTMTSMIKRLVERKLLKRESDPEDARVVRVGLTTTGVGVAEQAYEMAYEFEQKIVADLTPGDLKAVKKVLAAINKHTGVTVVENKRNKGSSCKREVRDG